MDHSINIAMEPIFTSESLYWSESLGKELLRFLTGRMKCPEIAADLTHETYLSLRQFVKESPPDNARALAYKIALRLAIDYQRKVEVRHRFMADEWSNDALLEQIGSDLSLPERILEGQEQVCLLKSALAELSPECRTVFSLHFAQGLKYSEIAERLDMSMSTVTRHLSKAVLHCRFRLAV